MKNTRQEPVFLLEMPHTLRHMIMRRGLMLRSGRTRTLCCMSKGGPKAWLEAKLIPTAGESAQENWDKAHELAGRFKRELHADVYVEPACEFGRFKEMTSPPGHPDMEDINHMLPTGPGLDPGQSKFGGAGLPLSHQDHGFGQQGAAGLMNPAAAGNQFGFGGPSMANMPGMPHIPDPMADVLPPEVRRLMSLGNETKSAQSSRPDLSFAPLHDLPGWQELPENKRKMFEVEGAQLHASGAFTHADNALQVPSLSGGGDQSERALAALTVHPKISGALKRFLLESFEAASKNAAIAEPH